MFLSKLKTYILTFVNCYFGFSKPSQFSSNKSWYK